MEIKFKSSDKLDKRAIYMHTRASSTSMKDVEPDTVIEPAEIVIYSDTNSKGEEQIITSIVDVNGEHFTTNSKFFREELGVIWKLMAPDPFSIRVKKNISKNGRAFVTCELA